MTKRQEFTVLKTYPGFELREYKPCVIAEVKSSANYSDAGSSAFGSLFSYISKGNKAEQAIAMTAPVITAKRFDNLTEDEWFVSFVMPAGSTLADMPLPINSKVVLRELGAEICVAASFRGKATTALSARKSLHFVLLPKSKTWHFLRRLESLALTHHLNLVSCNTTKL